MFIVEDDPNDLKGYRVKLSWGTGVRSCSVKARSLHEVHSALDHYYGREGHRSHTDCCPLCRDIAKHANRPKRKRGALRPTS